jgi:uncharacterized protein
VRYWDTSALLPLVIAEAETPRMRRLLEEDPHIVTCAWTPVEFASAVERRARQGELTRDQRRSALTRFTEPAEVWDEVTDVLMVCVGASWRSSPPPAPIRAADAAQLGAALAVAPGREDRSGSSVSMNGCSTPRNAKACARFPEQAIS